MPVVSTGEDRAVFAKSDINNNTKWLFLILQENVIKFFFNLTLEKKLFKKKRDVKEKRASFEEFVEKKAIKNRSYKCDQRWKKKKKKFPIAIGK